MAGNGGHRQYKNSKQETDQTVVTITKRSPKRLIVLLKPKKWRGTTKNFRCFAPDQCPLPHFQIRSGTTVHNNAVAWRPNLFVRVRLRTSCNRFSAPSIRQCTNIAPSRWCIYQPLSVMYRASICFPLSSLICSSPIKSARKRGLSPSEECAYLGWIWWQ